MIPVVVVLGGGLTREFSDWFLALNWLKHNQLSAEIVRKSDGKVLQRRVQQHRSNAA